MEPIFLVVDLFCGFGGTTTGFVEAKVNGNDVAKVIACVNHDPKAIKSHWLNHPDVAHFEEDIRTLDLSWLQTIVDHWKNRYPSAYLVLWASLECTNFSKAKGGMPREADSRTLAEHLYRYVEALTPDYIQIENVVEFMSWGPLDENGKPISKKNGEDWMRWRNTLCNYGYFDEWKQLNSADFGSYTSRNRLFGCFAKNGLPIVWPEPTHSKYPEKTGLKKWKAVKDVLHFEDEGESIFCRNKPLSEKTLERIYAGLVKYVAKGDKSYVVKHFSGRPMGKVTSVDSPAGTITTVANQSLVQANFLLKYNSVNKNTGVHHPPSIEDPCPTVSCQGRLGLVQPSFLAYYYGNSTQTSVEQPCNTLTTKDRASLVQPEFFIDRQFKSITNQSVEEPAGTITTVPKLNLVECKRFLLNPQFNNTGNSIEKPCFTLIARMDKRPPYLVEAESGEVAIEIYEADSPMAIKIKEFMACFGIIDVKMRMLRVRELLKIQGFPEDYKMLGNQSDQKKFIGNSVEPKIPRHWAEAMAFRLITFIKKRA